MKVLLVGSSSGGHVYPSLRLGEYLKKRDIDICYLGIKGEIDEKIYPKETRYLIELPKSFKLSLKHPFKCLKIYKELNKFILGYDAIIAFGGFITFFLSRLSNINKVPFYIHEANVIFGDSNLLSMKKATKVFTSFNITSSKKYSNKIILTGNPCVENLSKTKTNKGYISFMFGSLGSLSMLDKIISFLNISNEDEKYLLITGNNYYEYTKEKLKQKNNVLIKRFVDRDFLYKNSKLVFIRGGASTLMEVMYSSTNAICIPSPYVKHHHQEINAEYLFNHHAIMMIEEKNLNDKKIKEAIDIYKKRGYRDIEIKNQKNFTIDNPCFKIYQEIIHDYKK